MRVVAMLSDSLIMVAMRRTVGKDEKSSGRSIHSATISMRTESAIEVASPTSMRKAGIGRNSAVSMTTMPSAKKMSRPFRAVLEGMLSLIAILDTGHEGGAMRPGSRTLNLQACAKMGGGAVRSRTSGLPLASQRSKLAVQPFDPARLASLYRRNGLLSARQPEGDGKPVYLAPTDGYGGDLPGGRPDRNVQFSAGLPGPTADRRRAARQEQEIKRRHRQ